MPNEERPQDFELIELLIREAVGASTSVQQSSGVDESFRARFQSYIDQIPSYMHSIEKKGFFPHFFFGSFSTLLDTEIAGKLGIERICFSFDGSQTLKVAVIKKGEIRSREDAVDKVRLFVISEQGAKIATQRFSYGELRDALGRSNPGKFQHVFDNQDELKVKLVTINKDKINQQGVSVVVTDKKLHEDNTSRDKFKEIEKGLWNKPEDEIAKLAGSDEQIVRGTLEKVLEGISKVHSEYENSLEYGKEGRKTFREAAHHGFIAGALNNFRYRHNLRVYLEQFAGRGYADIVLLARGPNRALDSIPVIIELKAGKVRGTAPGKALQQATDYAKGFQPNVMRVLTTADDILCVGVNLDYPSPISNIETKNREGEIIPLFQDMLKSTDDWDMQRINKIELKKQIKDNLERIYHTFPGTGEKGDNHYFSRFLLGQSLLLNEVEDLKTKFEKHIFIYDRDENIPTEIYPESGRPQRPAAQQAKGKLSTGLNKSHAVVSMVLIPESTEKLVYVINIVEANRKDVLNKVLPLDRLSQEIGNREIVKLNLNFDTRHKSNFERYLTVEASDPVSLEQYNERGIDKFQGTFREVPYPDQLKETFDRALDSQRTQSSMGEYNELFKKIGEGIWPFKTLIGKETNFQGVLHGAFSYYSDLKLQESSENRALVLTEFQTGRGERIDMLVHGVGFADQDNNAKEYTPIGLELKASRQGKRAQALLKEANDQINKEYKEGVTYKTLTDGDEVKFIGVVFNKGAKDAGSLILTSKKSISVQVVHSSIINIARRKHLERIQKVIQNTGIQDTLESATEKRDYHYWLQQHDIADIARIEYGYETGGADTLFEIVGSPEHIANQLQQFQNSVTTRDEGRPLTLVVNLGNSHWVTLVIAYQNGQYNGYYVDSLGGNIPDNIRQVLQQGKITVHDVSVPQQTDGHNCGLWALENARDINAVLELHDIPSKIRNRLQVGERNEDYFVHMREDISERLSIDQQRIANLETILAETRQPRRELSPDSCVKQGGRSRRNVNPCLFSKDDVKKFSKGKVDESNVDKIIIDSEKFLTYVKSSQNEGKNAQLIEFVGDKSIEGNHKYLLNEVVQDGGYVNYAQNKRIKGLQNDVLQQDGGLAKNSKLKSRLINVAGRIQLIRGIHGATVSCKDGTATDCGLNLGGIAWSFASQPIENVIVRITPKLVKQAESFAGKVISGTLGKQTKFAIRVVGVKFATPIAKGTAGALAGAPDIIDIGMSANNLVNCKNRENSDNPCGEKEIRDNIASISFSGISFVSGIALTAASMPVAGTVVGFVLMVGQGIYSGVSNIIEYEKRYDTTHYENWSIFWRTLSLKPMSLDIQALEARHNIVNSIAQEAWQALSNSSDSVVAYAEGFGNMIKRDSVPCRPSGPCICDTNKFGVGFHKICDLITATGKAGYAVITMNEESNANTENLSRVLPDAIQNAKMICLPHITNEDYEKGLRQSVPTAVHYCENAMVIADRRKDMRDGKTIVYNLRNVNEGTIVGSNKLNNSFLIFEGKESITGGNSTVNRFALTSFNFSGKIVLGSNSTNVFDLSTVIDDIIRVNINHGHLKPDVPSTFYSGALQIKINDRLLINEYVSSNINTSSGYHYVGRQNKVDQILCTGSSENRLVSYNIMINSGGGYSNTRRDTIENCRRVTILPYTDVKGTEGNYIFYIKITEHKGRDLHSEIDIKGTGTVIFTETDLLSNYDEITYSSSNNTLSLKIKLDQDSQYTLDIKNYIEQGSDKPNFVLIDKNGSNIIPKIEKLESPLVKISSFELHTEYPLDDFDAVENHYKKILNNDKDYKVFGVIKDKVQNQGDSIVSHMVFGSSGSDIIKFDQGTMFARGGNGSDIYVIDSGIGAREVIIDNDSDDKELDVLLIPEVPEEFLIQQRNLYLNCDDTYIQVKNYLQNDSYRHLMVVNSKGETFIPYVQSILHADSLVDNGELVPFFHATQTQNMFFLSKDFLYNHVVIDSRSEDIEQYRDKDDLLLIRESEVPFIMKIEGYYDGQSKWKNVNFLLWNNSNFTYFDLPQEIAEIVNYQDKLKADYEKVIKEYVIDFSDHINIMHNQKYPLTPVEQDEERVGVIILKGITPGQIRVSSSDSHLVFRDTESNHVIRVENWDNSEFYRISTLEFDLGLDPIIIRRLNRFSLSNVAEIQTLIDKASENYQNRVEYSSGTEDDLKCLVSVNGFKNENKTYECLGFSSLQDQINFTEGFCSLEQINKFKDEIPSPNQVLPLLRKLQNDFLLNGYGQGTVGQCSDLMLTEIVRLLVSKKDEHGYTQLHFDSGANIEVKGVKNAAFKLAYYVKGIMEMSNYHSVHSEKRSELEVIKRELPESVKNAVFSSEVCIKNVYQNEYLYAASDSLDYDSNRRRVFTWRPGGKDEQSVWKIEPNGDNIYIKSADFNEYLYAVSDSLSYDSNRRRVFTWRPGGKDEQSVWKIEPNGDNVYIKSADFNEYLYAADYAPYDSNRRRVFTWRPGGRDTYCVWWIEDCGSIRKKRDIQYDRGQKHLQEGKFSYRPFIESVGDSDRHSIAKEAEYDLSYNNISNNSLQNDEIDYNKVEATSGASKLSSWIIDTVKGVYQFISSSLRAVLHEKSVQSLPNVSQHGEEIKSSSPSGFLSVENIALIGCVAEALDNTPSKRYQTLKSQGVDFVPSIQTAVNFARREFDSFVEDKIRNLDSEGKARIRTEVKNAYPEIIESFRRGVEFSGNIGLDDVLEKCKECFCTNILPNNVSQSESQMLGKTDDKPETRLSGVTVNNQLKRSQVF